MSTPTEHEIDAHSAHEQIERDEAVLVDVREPDEHARERIEGAQLHPLSRFDPAAIQRKPGQKVILHCRSGKRSLDALRTLREHDGTVEARSLAGGIIDWKKCGKPVQFNRTAPLPIMRQVQLAAGAIVLAGTLAGAFVSSWLLLVPGFVGSGLIFAGATGTCGLASLLGVMPWNRMPVCTDAKPAATGQDHAEPSAVQTAGSVRPTSA